MSGQIRLGQVRSGQARLGQVGSGQVRSGQVRPGQVRSGQVRLGQIRSGQVRPGQAWIKLVMARPSSETSGLVSCISGQKCQIEMIDANTLLGNKIILKDPTNQNENGELFDEFLERNECT